MQSINSIIQLKAEIIFDIKVASLVNQYLSNVAVDPPITCLVGISQSAERNLTSNSYIAAKGICAQVQTNLKSISLIFAYIYIYFNKLTAISKTLTL